MVSNRIASNRIASNRIVSNRIVSETCIDSEMHFLLKRMCVLKDSYSIKRNLFFLTIKAGKF